MSKENVDFAHPIFGPYFMYCAPNLRLLPPPLNIEGHIAPQHTVTTLILSSPPMLVSVFFLKQIKEDEEVNT